MVGRNSRAILNWDLLTSSGSNDIVKSAKPLFVNVSKTQQNEAIRTLSSDQLGEKEEIVLNKNAIAPIQSLMRKHRNWHPSKFPSTILPFANDSSLTVINGTKILTRHR